MKMAVSCLTGIWLISCVDIERATRRSLMTCCFPESYSNSYTGRAGEGSLTLQVHFLSFCEHLVASAASCTAWMVMLVTCLKENRKGDKARTQHHILMPLTVVHGCAFPQVPPVLSVDIGFDVVSLQNVEYDWTEHRGTACTSPPIPVNLDQERPLQAFVLKANSLFGLFFS